MKCERAIDWVDALADGEVRGWRRIALRRHLAGCPGCGARLDEALALRERIREEAPRFFAPAGLRARIGQLRDGAAVSPLVPARPGWRWAIGGAFAGSAATLAAVLAFQAWVGLRAASDAALAMVEEHARANVAQRAVVVASSDQHTVKPWLSSHLEYSPPVHDFTDDGFALIGARIVHLHGHSIAVLAYRYRLHAIDVYVQPSSSSADARAASIRGFNLLPIRAYDMDWAIVSDASVQTLEKLAMAIRDAGP